MLQNKKTDISVLFILSFEEVNTLLYFFDGSIKIYTTTIHRFLKKHHAYYYTTLYKQPMFIFEKLFIPTCSPRNKKCVWVNTEIFKLDTIIYHCQNIKRYKAVFILENVYLVYLKVMEQIYMENNQL